VSALEHGRLSEIYNLSSGVGLSNLDVIEGFKPLMQEIGYEAQVENLPERAFDVKANVLDSTKLSIDTGWKPQIGFIEGMTITRDWLVGLAE
jgi:UDP-glucose 4-epimerase